MSLAALVKQDTLLGDQVIDDWLRESGCPLVRCWALSSLPPHSDRSDTGRRLHVYLDPCAKSRGTQEDGAVSCG